MGKQLCPISPPCQVMGSLPDAYEAVRAAQTRTREGLALGALSSPEGHRTRENHKDHGLTTLPSAQRTRVRPEWDGTAKAAWVELQLPAQP